MRKSIEATTSSLNIMTHSSPFRIAVIGCGWIANSQHGPAYARYAREHPEVKLAACCDVDEGKARAFAKSFGFTNVYTQWAEMLRREQPSAACLNVPPEMIAPLGEDILRLGLPLILEKPPGLALAEVDRLIRAADESGTPHQVAFNRRFTPLVQKLKLALDQAGPQALQHIQYDFFRIGRTDPDFSTTAIHGIDAVRYLAGCDYAKIRFMYQDVLAPNQGSRAFNLPSNITGSPASAPIATNFYLDCTMASGATARLSFLPVSGAVLERATIHLLDRLFFLRLPVWNGFDMPGSLQEVAQGQVIRTFNGPEISGREEEYVLNGFWDEDASFFDDIRQGRHPLCDLHSARQSVAIMQAMRQRWERYPRM